MSRTRNDVLISALLVLLLVWVVWEARDWPFRTRLFPWSIGFPVLGLALVQFGIASWKAFRGQLDSAVDEVDGEPGEKADSAATLDSKVLTRRTLSIAAWTIVFALGFWSFGFKVGGLVLSPAFLRFQARETWKMSILYGLGVYLFFLGGFEMALGFPLPPGIIAASLGLQSFDWYVVNPILNLILRR
ncbi:MAG: tripartite tricarboxylate transporter TctB family protein [Candidatus Binatia bacterium]